MVLINNDLTLASSHEEGQHVFLPTQPLPHLSVVAWCLEPTCEELSNVQRPRPAHAVVVAAPPDDKLVGHGLEQSVLLGCHQRPASASVCLQHRQPHSLVDVRV